MNGYKNHLQQIKCRKDIEVTKHHKNETIKIKIELKKVRKLKNERKVKENGSIQERESKKTLNM